MSALKTYGQLLRDARRARQWTLEKLASALETKWSVTYLGEVERGSRAPLDVTATQDLTQALGLQPHVLLDARARYYEQSTLQLGLRPDQDEAALMLSRRWASYSRDQILRIVEAAS